METNQHFDKKVIVRARQDESVIGRVREFMLADSAYKLVLADGVTVQVPAAELVLATKTECMKFLCDTAIDTNATPWACVRVGCNAGWDEPPEFVLYKVDALDRLLKPVIKLMETQKHVIDIDSVVIADSLEQIFLTDTQFTDECLTEDNAEEFELSDFYEMIVVDGVVYRADSDPSSFTESVWNTDGINVNAYGYATIRYVSKHSDESLWFCYQYTETQAAA